jgi:hypothetical protein
MATKKQRKKKPQKKAQSGTTPQPRVATEKAVTQQPQTTPEFELLAVTPADPLGACIWYDNTGQPHCTTTTQNLCKAKGGTFYPNQACPGMS